MGLADITFVSPFILPQAIHPFADVSLTSKRRTIYAPSWERVFSLVWLQFFPLGVAKMMTFNAVFFNNGSQYTTKFLPNEVEVLIFWKADMCPKVGKSIGKVALVCHLRPLREGI